MGRRKRKKIWKRKGWSLQVGLVRKTSRKRAPSKKVIALYSRQSPEYMHMKNRYKIRGINIMVTRIIYNLVQRDSAPVDCDLSAVYLYLQQIISRTMKKIF
jgi:hypothetical protein